jgi:hypothetical protein
VISIGSWAGNDCDASSPTHNAIAAAARVRELSRFARETFTRYAHAATPPHSNSGLEFHPARLAVLCAAGAGLIGDYWSVIERAALIEDLFDDSLLFPREILSRRQHDALLSSIAAVDWIRFIDNCPIFPMS